METEQGIAMDISNWLKKKENRAFLVFVLVGVILYFYIRNRNKATNVGYTDARIGIPGGGSPSTGTPGSFQPYPPGNGVIKPKVGNFGYPGHMNLVATGSPGNWTINDTAVIDVPPGKSMRYYIGSGETIITKTPLMGYKWESNFPITFTKMIITDGVDDLYFFGPIEAELRRPQDGAPMFGNTFMAFQTFYFNSI